LVAALAGGVVIWMASPAAAGPLVDPTTLQPRPPPNAVCRDDGPQVICDTFVDETAVNEPISDLDLPCGTIYETSHFHGAGIRWYVDGLLVKRQVVADLQGTWSLSPTGDAPTVSISGTSSFWTFWAVPGDDSTASETHHGNGFKVSAPGFGVLIHDAGLTYSDGTHRGVLRLIEDPQVAAAVCAALTA
jgi:hypothetical protein